MRRMSWQAAPFLLALLLAGCGGTVPAARYYVLDYEMPPAPRQTPADLVLGIEGFSTSPLLSDRRIAHRASAHEVVYYPNHYWAASPGALVAEQIARRVRHAGAVRAVEVAPYGRTPDWLLGGSIDEFEEVERGGQSVAHIAMTVRLETVADRRILREEEIEVERPVTRRNPEQVAAAMSAAVAEASAQVLGIIQQEALESASR